MDKKTVAIVVPIYAKSLNVDQGNALRHLRYFLGRHDKYFIMPKDLDLEIEQGDFLIKRFKNKYFQSRQTYNNLMLSEELYRAFNDYEYILIYQLDCLVFSDQLLDWCKKGYDYIGAPWYKLQMEKYVIWPFGEANVGNGGFSLRKIESHLKVLAVYNQRIHIFNNVKRKLMPFVYLFKYYLRIILKEILARRHSWRTVLRKVRIKKQDIDELRNEDVFWSFEAKKYYPDFKIPPAEVAVSFSFEVEPEYAFEKNKRILPFGCHSGAVQGKDFWKPYLLK